MNACLKTDLTREEILRDPDTRRQWIKFQLAVHGTSLAKIAADLGVKHQTIRKALDSPYPKMERIIAARIGMEPQEVWPERYQTKASRARKGGRRG